MQSFSMRVRDGDKVSVRVYIASARRTGECEACKKIVRVKRVDGHKSKDENSSVSSKG